MNCKVYGRRLRCESTWYEDDGLCVLIDFTCIHLCMKWIGCFLMQSQAGKYLALRHPESQPHNQRLKEANLWQSESLTAGQIPTVNVRCAVICRNLKLGSINYFRRIFVFFSENLLTSRQHQSTNQMFWQKKEKTEEWVASAETDCRLAATPVMSAQSTHPPQWTVTVGLSTLRYVCDGYDACVYMIVAFNRVAY